MSELHVAKFNHRRSRSKFSLSKCGVPLRHNVTVNWCPTLSQNVALLDPT